MKVNHKNPKSKPVDTSGSRRAERSVEEMKATIVKLRAANEAAVRRAAALSVEVEALKKACAELRSKWEAAHAKVPA